MFLRTIVRGLCVVFLLQMTVGCVSYQKWRMLKEDHERGKLALRDLTAEYNKAVNQLDRAGEGAGPVTIQGVPQSEYDRLRSQLTQVSDELERQKQIQLEFTPADIQGMPDAKLESGGIALGSELLFNPGQSQLKSSQLPQLDQLASLLETKYPGQRVIVEGHTDNQPLKSVKNLYFYNINLGFERAYSVFKYLEKKHAIPESRFRIVTFGQTKPIDPSTANTEEGRAMNRRVVIRLAGEEI